MEENFEQMDNIISKYFAGEASREEIAMLEAWRNKLPENQKYFNQSKKVFAALADAKSGIEVNVDAAWEKVQNRIESKGEAKVIPIARRFTPLKVAAAAILFVALAVIVHRLFNSQPETIRLAAAKTIREEKLPDGSKVLMNKNAEISYEITEGKRKVKLKGEAFFEVIHNEEQPFEIEVSGVMIKDIGTAFNVKALPESNLIEVYVESGEVQFYTTNSAGINLVKGEKAIYNKSAGTFEKVNIPVNDNTMSYRSKIFHFNNTTLKEVITEVNEVYGSDIRLSDEKLGNCRLSVEFNNEDIDVLVSIIAETLDLQVENNNGAKVLKGNVCPE